MNEDWISVLMQLRERREPCVLLTLLADKGSVPRNCGTKMVVGREQTYLTIGGGHLEYQHRGGAGDAGGANHIPAYRAF